MGAISVAGRPAAPDEQALEIERHWSVGAVRGIEARGDLAEKFIVSIFRDHVEKGSQTGRAVPLNDVSGTIHRMMKRQVIAVDPLVAEFREHRRIISWRIFAKGALAPGEYRAPRLLARELSEFELCGLGFIGRNLHHDSSARLERIEACGKQRALIGNPLKGRVREYQRERAIGVEPGSIEQFERYPALEIFRLRVEQF